MRRLQRQRPPRGDPAASTTARPKGSRPHLEVAGKRGIAYFRFRGIAADATYTQFEDQPAVRRGRGLADRYIGMFVRGEIDRVDVAYTKFVSVARQRPVVETLLPMTAAQVGEAGAVGPPGAGRRRSRPRPPAERVPYEFLPDARSILEEIVPVSFKVRLFKCFLDAAVSEQIARRVAMKAATENADEMIKSLTTLVQPRPPGADHQRARRDHRRRRGARIRSGPISVHDGGPRSETQPMATATGHRRPARSSR